MARRQKLDRLADQFVRRVAEQTLQRTIRIENQACCVDYQQAIRNSFEDFLKYLHQS